MNNKQSISVLFICLGNICRSPAAEAVMKKVAADNGMDGWLHIESAAIGPWHVGDLPDSRIVRFIKKHHVLTLATSFNEETWCASCFYSYLEDENCFLDMSSSMRYLGPRRTRELCEIYGADRMMFGSDFPMWNPGSELEKFRALGFSEAEYEKMCWHNAERWLDVEIG